MSNNITIIFGATGGIGSELSTVVSTTSEDILYMSSRNQTSLDNLSKSLNNSDKIILKAADVTNEKSELLLKIMGTEYILMVRTAKQAVPSPAIHILNAKCLPGQRPDIQKLRLYPR